MRSSVFVVVLALGLPAAAATAQDAVMRFQGLDTNRDGVITRDEWRGSDRAFRNNDWNGDGKLSGEEVRPGAPRRSDWDRDVPQAGDFSAARFRSLDYNRDGRLARSEWSTSSELFARLDRNRDGFLSEREFTGTSGTIGTSGQATDRFVALDTNRDGHIAREEWRGSAAVFAALDTNGDGVLTREEAVGNRGGPQDEFRSVDVNGDGVVSLNEWHWNRSAFDRLDSNRDGRLSRQEWENAPQTTQPSQTPAYRAGYERGRQDGVQAGREDKPRGWDLDGQRELETADAGYQATVGSHAEYQSGYRAGFRRGYYEGFGR